MNKENALNYIINAMSLRTPQEKSLRIFANYLDSPAGTKLLNLLKKSSREPLNNLKDESIKYFSEQESQKQFLGFDNRSYPTFTYALATGVGKTRLMGAFVSYLFLVHGVKHFLIVAPGNTIYRKLFEDFSKQSSPKYVFKGIEELNSNNVNIISKDNFLNSQNQDLGLFKNKIEINILNVQQFSQKDIDKQKGITKASEEFGVRDGKFLSYFDYLSELEDLVVLLDESHHYHADAAFQSLDRLSPLFGLEFTATPYTGETEGRGSEKKQKMKESIVYLYNLGDAIRDGFVKDPWIGTEQDVNFSNFDNDSIETDLRKLQLAVLFHDRAKSSIKKFALDNSLKVVKPVMLIVAKDISHAEELKNKISSKDFRGGEFIGKVLVVHSNNTSDSDSTIEQLISLENPKNYIEIIIHVNMLKEGWDVSNIYTIVPLRTSAAQILTEQTIGRGLRLPYGERTGDPIVDRVVIVAHEEYQKVVEQARNSKIIQPSNIEVISNLNSNEFKYVIEAKPVQLERIEDQIRNNDTIQSELLRKAEVDLSETFNDTTTDEVKQNAIEARVSEYNTELAKISAKLTSGVELQKTEFSETLLPEHSLFSSLSPTSIDKINEIVSSASKEYEVRNILIPKLFITPEYRSLVIKDFELDTSEFIKYDPNIKIIETRLQKDQKEDLYGNITYDESKTSLTIATPQDGFFNQSPIKTLIAALWDHPLIDYDDLDQKPILIKLTNQAIGHYKSFSPNESALARLIQTYARDISKVIYNQILKHIEFKNELSESSIGSPDPYLKQHNITSFEGEKVVNLESQINTFSSERIYSNFSKACHSHYKFDSSDEVRFAYLLEKDPIVIDWLRPAPKQFDKFLLWRDQEGNADNNYEPDFVVELENEILMIEIKPISKLNDFDVLAKKQSAEKYCDVVSNNLGKQNITKRWRYKIIPTEQITITSSINFLLS